MVKHEQFAWVPMRTEKNRHYFWPGGIRDLRREAKKDFAEYCCEGWDVLRKEGWRIVRVRLSCHLN